MKQELQIVEEDAIGGAPWKGSGKMTSMVHIDITDSSPEWRFRMLSAAEE